MFDRVFIPLKNDFTIIMLEHAIYFFSKPKLRVDSYVKTLLCVDF